VPSNILSDCPCAFDGRGPLVERHPHLAEPMREIAASGDSGCRTLLGDSLSLHRVLEAIEMVAPTDATVLIRGETGVGKELIARAIHERSPRRGHPLIKLNCTAIPRELFESE